MKDTLFEPFQGFSEDTLLFLKELGYNNNSLWMEENRDRYYALVSDKFKSLVAAMVPHMLSIDAGFEITPRVGKTISRINRDIRFSLNKQPYRNNVWITFKTRRENWWTAPCYFFELYTDHYRYGMGYYSPTKNTMDNMREYILEKPAKFHKLINPIVKDGRFIAEGEQYKRKPSVDVPEDLYDWYQKKDLCFITYRPIDELLFTPQLVDVMLKDFDMLKPMYEFMWSLVEV
jgi:uncharacterized protein (TIGR02453 family)